MLDDKLRFAAKYGKTLLRRIVIEPFLFIFTVRNSSCGKVMFSQVCVKNSVHSGRRAWQASRDGHCSGRYASYWNAFSVIFKFLENEISSLIGNRIIDWGILEDFWGPMGVGGV